MEHIVSAIEQEIQNRLARPGDHRLILAIDGRCAAGKTTLAQQLCAKTDGTVFHMDDFFLPPDLRTKQRLSVPGENVDHERFLSEILQPLKKEQTEIAYRRFDCRSNTFSPWQTVTAAKIVIIEGSYSCHPAFWDLCDLHIFLSVSPKKQLQRIIQRNGTDAAKMFEHRWIPLEEAYFAAFDIANRCEMCFGNE